MATNEAPEPGAPDVLSRDGPAGGQSLALRAGLPRKLSDDLTDILREFEVEEVTLREVLAVMHGRGYLLLVMLLALPFSTPIPLPGLSTPFGLVIGLIGARLALGQKPWLPKRLLDTRLPPRLFTKVFAATRKILCWFEYFLRPRQLWITRSLKMQQLHAVPILLSALILLLPLPVPFSNSLPAISILLISAGLLERDGLFVAAGYAAFAFAVAYLVFVALVGAEGVVAIKHWLGF